VTTEGEMYDEINTLVGSLAKAYDIEGTDAARAVENGSMRLELGVDASGDKYVKATFRGKVAVVYPGAAKAEMDAKATKHS